MDTSFEDILTWEVEAIKQFLSARGLSTDGTKNELVALCFSAIRLNLPVLPTQSEILKLNEIEYKKLLSAANIPDPFSICDNWCDEKTGLVHWPPVFLTDIVSFFMDSDSESTKKYLNDYKIGKAYEYYSSNWIKEVFYHEIHKDHVCCLLRAKCTPSQRISDDQHNVWVCITKDDGIIRAAYCSCTAGLGQTCNHIAGLLFRIEAANKLGITSCTSSKCSWNVPREKTILTQKPLASLNIVKSRHGKKKSRPLVTPDKRKFTPAVDESTGTDITDLISSLRVVAPNACLFKGIVGEEIQTVATRNIPTVIDENITDILLDSDIIPIFDVSKYYMSNLVGNYKVSKNKECFTTAIPTLSSDDQWSINCQTTGQHVNEEWKMLREGRITASNFYSVYTRVNTVKSKPDENVDSLLSSLCGYISVNKNIKSLKFGRENEPVAKLSYTTEVNKAHNDFQLNECGIFISKQYPFLAASPDALLSCSCCGDGVLEVKSFLVEKCEKCINFCKCKVPVYLTSGENGDLSLKKNHAYFAQVQAQMAFTERQWCDFYVHSVNGSFLERIAFDIVYFDEILKNVLYFFTTYMVPELLSGKLKQELGHSSNQRQPQSIHGNTYFCPICNSVIKEGENIRSFSERSICCDKCNKWYHFRCVKISKASLVMYNNTDWFCSNCSSNNN